MKTWCPSDYLVAIFTLFVFLSISVLAFPDDGDLCLTMVPKTAKTPQTLTAQFEILANQSNYRENNILEVTIRAYSGFTFRDFLIEARRVGSDKSLNEPIGSFSGPFDTVVVCQNPTGNGLTRESNSALTAEVKLYWKAPPQMEGHLQFRATVALDADTYWVGIKSGIIIDQTAPALPTIIGECPPIIDSSQCGKGRGCYRNPAGCHVESCDVIASWIVNENSVVFELSADTDGWVAIGLSYDTKMGEDDVMECVYDKAKQSIDVRLSQNEKSGKRNAVSRLQYQGLSSQQACLVKQKGRIHCRFERQVFSNKTSFNLKDAYHMLLAHGRVDDAGNKLRHVLEPEKYPWVSPQKISFSLARGASLTGRAKYPLVKIHGCLMIIAWMMCAGTAVIMAKYYKRMWPNDSLCKERVWFAVHRGCMVVVLGCVVVAVILIFIHAGGWSQMPDLPEKAHPILGIITAILVVLNPAIALCRCKDTSEYRPIFNWIHWFIGTVAFILQSPALFIGLNLPKAHVPWWATWVMVAFMLFHLIIELLLEIHGCLNGPKQDMRDQEQDVSLIKKSESRDDRGDQPEPVGYHFKTRIITVYVIVAAVLGIVMVIAIATG